ncbi:metal-dependent hydrolase [Methanobacterium sp. ACI-7]|uniref:metal-dependent hydrolase n=1 Tax=unclassified Methanobacterium TaxID=2627676 RepID=UPI0039C0F13F
MPDWITHVLVAWTLTTVLGFRYKKFSQPNAAIVMLGALIPDIYKINLLSDQLGLYFNDFLTPIHLPIGSLLIAALFSLFFSNRKSIFLFLIMGIATHYMLDLLLFSGGMAIFYPLNPLKFQIGIISITDFNITLISIILAFFVFIAYKMVDKKKIT